MPARPARPGAGLTTDGRRRREVVTYTRRGSRMTSGQQAAWDRRAGAWLVDEDAVDELAAGALDLRALFGREAPLAVEVGSGVGEATVALASARRNLDVLAFEVWVPGIAQTFLGMEEAGVTNVRLVAVDAVWSLEHLLAPRSVHELWTFFPDPWPKQRHHKRRLVTPSVAALAASRLEPGGVWRLATDWPPYAEQMVAVLDAEPALVGGEVPRWEQRPLTRFERRGMAAGRPVVDLAYRRRDS